MKIYSLTITLMVVLAAIVGFVLGCAIPGHQDGSATVISPWDGLLSKLGPGDKVRIETSQGKTGSSASGPTGSDDIAHVRILTPFGVSPGEAIQHTQGIQTDGRNGFSVGATDWSWWDSFKQSVKTWAIVIVIGVVLVLVGLNFPATAPISKAIISVVTLGGAWLWAHTLGKQTEQVVAGGEKFKTAVADSTTLPQAAKDEVYNLFIASQKAAQDKTTQATVKGIIG